MEGREGGYQAHTYMSHNNDLLQVVAPISWPGTPAPAEAHHGLDRRAGGVCRRLGTTAMRVGRVITAKDALNEGMGHRLAGREGGSGR